MRVKVANRVYAMSRKKFEGLLSVASNQVSFGIYAVEKNGYAELMNINVKSVTELKKISRTYKSQGYRVYSNRG